MAMEIHSIQNTAYTAEQVTQKDIQKQQAEARQKIELQPVTEAELASTLDSLNKLSSLFNKHLSYSVNKELDQVVVKVIDKDTDKVIKEIPPEEIQQLSMRIREAIGILFDETI